MSLSHDIVEQEYNDLVSKVSHLYAVLVQLQEILPLSEEIANNISQAKSLSDSKKYIESIDVILQSMEKLIGFSKDFLSTSIESTSYNV